MKRKRMLSALLVVAMAATMFAGCGNKGGSNSSTQGGKAANDGDIKEFTAFFAVPGSEINDDNEVQQIIAEKTGVKVKETWLTGQTAEEAIGTLVAGDEYPDFICGGNGMPQLYDAGALVALDDYIDKYPNIKNYFTEQEWDQLRQDDGHIYWIPQFSNIKGEEKTCTHNDEAFWIQAMGLKKRLEHTGANAVVGISGGLDSTLALLVTVRAFDLCGRDHKGITAVTMPGFGTTDRTYDNAVKLIQSLGAEFVEVDICQAVNVHFSDIGQDPSVHDVTYENSQARERTQILMDIANKKNALVIGTGDLSELALGWATYNGDHMSMYAVNASVPKTLVRHLVRYYADTCEDKQLSDTLYDVLDTPVSPELLPPEDGKISQKTEDLVGPYELHDFFLYYMLRQGFSPAKIYRLAKIAFAGTYEDAFILKWLKTFCRRFFAQQFKRSCLPDGPKVGSVAVSPRGDLRMPSDACATLWMEELNTIS